MEFVLQQEDWILYSLAFECEQNSVPEEEVTE